MLQTLFYIPHFVFQGPLLISWLIVGALICGFLFIKRGATKNTNAKNESANDSNTTSTSDAIGFLPVYIIVALVIHFLLPRLEVVDIDGNPIGLAVRGYGMFMLFAIVTGLAAAWVRCRQIGFNFEVVLALSFWMIICGIVGARVFYLIQKNSERPIQNLTELPLQLIDMTEGGLVVYGAIIGGVAALLVFVAVKKLPLMRIADIIAPGMAIGLAIGRVGCLMNGCCFGGTCNIDAIGIQFPPGSPPYSRQIETGLLLDMTTSPLFDHPEKVFREMDSNEDEKVDSKEFTQWSSKKNDVTYRLNELAFHEVTHLIKSDLVDARVVESIPQGSRSAEAGIQVGELISVYPNNSDLIRAIKKGEKDPEGNTRTGNVIVVRPTKADIAFSIESLPDRGVKIHPTQIYSSINATLIFLFLWFYYPFRKGHGEIFAWMLILYAVTRFCLESIRIDELPFLGPFTISQTISFGVLVVGIAMLTISRMRFAINDAERVAERDQDRSSSKPQTA